MAGPFAQSNPWSASPGLGGFAPQSYLQSTTPFGTPGMQGQQSGLQALQPILQSLHVVPYQLQHLAQLAQIQQQQVQYLLQTLPQQIQQLALVIQASGQQTAGPQGFNPLLQQTGLPQPFTPGYVM